MPRNYVAPANYYKLRGMAGVSGSGQMEKDRRPPLTTSIDQRLVGSRFQEMHRESVDAAQALGSAVHIDQAGDLRAGHGPPRPRTFSLEQGPNHPDQPVPTTATTTDIDFASHSATRDVRTPTSAGISWADTEHPTSGTAVDSTPERHQHSRWGTWGTLVASTPTARGASDADDATVRRRGVDAEPGTGDRDTFPMRPKEEIEVMPPPHLRLQQQQPFVRPRSGLDHEHLGAIYGDIGVWRSRLKSINADIADAQQEGYNDIAEGNQRVKGWLLVGRGVRFVKGVRMIEGRAKDDIRWDELQRDGGLSSDIIFWIVVFMIALTLGVGGTWISHSKCTSDFWCSCSHCSNWTRSCRCARRRDFCTVPSPVVCKQQHWLGPRHNAGTCRWRNAIHQHRSRARTSYAFLARSTIAVAHARTQGPPSAQGRHLALSQSSTLSAPHS